MKNLIKIIVFLAFFLFLCHSCNTRKKVAQKEKVVYKSDTLYKRDSIFITKEKVVTVPTVIERLVKNPCDSTGNLKDFNINIPTAFGNVNINSEGGDINTKVNTDSISSVYESQYSGRNVKQVSRINELEREKTGLVKSNDFYKILFFVSLGVNIVFVVVVVYRLGLK